MRTIEATDRSVSIWISREPPPGRAELLALVRRALEEQGLAPWPETETECFRAGQDTLIIARPGRALLGFWFAELESLLAGVFACGEGESSLYALPEGYLLTLDRASAAPALWEYGQERTVSADWERHADEQGLTLLRGGALADLRRYFSR